MGFQNVFGHLPAVRALRKALANDVLAGTYLFTGPAGIGKTTLAQAFAQAAACLSPTLDPFDACGTCDACRHAAGAGNPEIALISPAGDQTQIWQFWDRDGKPAGALQRALNYAPSIGRRRVFIIERADTLTEGAANSLLKALEEPPPYVLFILLAPQAARLLPTILSRSQQLRLSPAPRQELAQYLMASTGVSPDRAEALAAYSEGRTGAALGLARGKGVDKEIAGILDLAHSLTTADNLGAPKLSERIRKQAAGLKAMMNVEAPDQSDNEEEAESAPREKAGRRQLGTVLELMTAYYRDVLAARLAGPDARLLHGDRKEDILTSAERRPSEAWARCIEHLLKARRRIEQNANPRLVTDTLAVQLITAV